MATTDKGRPSRPPLSLARSVRSLLRALVVVSLGTLLGLVALACWWRQPWPSGLFPAEYERWVPAADSEREQAVSRAVTAGGGREWPATGLWHLRAARAQEAWAHLERTGWQPVKVGLYDGVIDASHPDLIPAMEPGLLDDPPLYAGRWLVRDNHGSGLAGVIAGQGSPGMTGVNPRAWLVPFATHTNRLDASVTNALRAFADAGVRVGNFSIAPPWPVVDQAAVDQAYRQGVLVVTGLPNRNSDAPAHPAAMERTLVVSGATADDEPAGFGYGPLLDLLAPSPTVLSTAPRLHAGPLTLGAPYQSICCNSVAVAIVTGAASLVLAADPTLTAAQVEKRLKLSARKPPGMQGQLWHERHGYGIVDADRALAYDRVGPVVSELRITTELRADGPGRQVVTGLAMDASEDAGLQPNRARDAHLLGVPVSNIARVEVRVGDGDWREADWDQSEGFGTGMVSHYGRSFHFQLPQPDQAEPVSVAVRAWDTAGNVGEEVWVRGGG